MKNLLPENNVKGTKTYCTHLLNLKNTYVSFNLISI